MTENTSVPLKMWSHCNSATV